MKKIFYIIFSLLLIGVISSSCSEDSLDPRLDEIRDNEKDPLKTDADMRSALTGAYNRMTSSNYYGRDVLIFGEVRGDNAYADPGYSNRFVNVSSFTLTQNHAYSSDTWDLILRVNNSANLIIAAEIEGGNKDVINDYRGQAYALRALAHFDLLRIYGQQHVSGHGLSGLGVPYIVNFAELNTKNYKRLTVNENRELIYKDLDKALELMSDDVQEFTRLNKQSVYGLKSRIALYFSAWDDGELIIAKESAEKAMQMGGEIISKSAFVGSFDAEGKQVNSIFELAQSGTANGGTNSIYYIYSYDGYGDVIALDYIKDLFNEGEDVRASSKMLEVDPDEELRNIGKYTKNSSNIKIMRFEELVLNYVEAAYRLNNADANALKLLNDLVSERVEVTVKNNGADVVKPLTYTSLDIDIILNERRKELIFEGFRFDDMMRNKMDLPVNKIVLEPIIYGNTKLAFPIPQNEINISKIQQNEGY